MKKTIITLSLAALILFFAGAALRPIQAAQAEKELTYMLGTLLPGSETFTQEPYAGEDPIIQSVYKAENGFVLLTAAPGYAGEVSMLVGVSTEGKVTGVVIRQMEETPGLGMRALHDVDFLAQFLHTSGSAQVGETIDAISGATVTSKAVTRCVNSAVAYVTGADASSGATSWGG